MGKHDLGPVSNMLRLQPGPVDLSAIDPGSTPGFLGSKEAAAADIAELSGELSDLQERLYAHGRSGGHRSLLLIVQGMDTAGKGGAVKSVSGLMDPQGIRITSFSAPTERELRHDFLWRVAQHVPGGGTIQIFDRSQYEDVLIGRVRNLAGPDEIERRYGAINDFERQIADSGTSIVKVMLHISRKQQYKRLKARLDDPTKHWKFNPDDLDDRRRWHEYQDAYEIALERCNSDYAPWYVVPSDHKWYRTWAVTHLVLERLRSFGLDWPEAGYDVDLQRKRLEELK